ncbi:G1/S-specific cyclin-E1 [Pelodytes ibericus]
MAEGWQLSTFEQNCTLQKPHFSSTQGTDMPIMSCSTEDTKGQRASSSAPRSRKRKADVAIFLRDPDEKMEWLEMSRKRQCENKGIWNSELPRRSRYAFVPVPTPDNDQPELESSLLPHFNNLRFDCLRFSPLPHLGWANQDDVWVNMLNKDRIYARDKDYFLKHPMLEPSMRMVLLDWLMDVCEHNKLRRETFYLAQDYFDRFMALQEDIAKNRLQMIGVTCLFIAAKIEEIYPPKLHEFAFLTDGACTEDEIVAVELIIMKTLDWCLSPLTIVSWLNVYLQLAYARDHTQFLLPQYPQEIYIHIMDVLDLCVLDMESLQFPYRILVASVMYHFLSLDLVLKVSGCTWSELERCIKWVAPFSMVIKESKRPKLEYIKGIDVEDLHNIQTHTSSMERMEKAQLYKALLEEETRVSPVPSGVLTPPMSDKKSDV